jgi:hypothetical protein
MKTGLDALGTAENDSWRAKHERILLYANLRVIILIFQKLCVAMQPNFLKNSNNLFKQLFLMHLTYIL